MSRTVRTNLTAKLLSGAIRPRPGMHGTRPVPREPGPMETDAAVARVRELIAGGMEIGEAYRKVAQEVKG